MVKMELRLVAFIAHDGGGGSVRAERGTAHGDSVDDGVGLCAAWDKVAMGWHCGDGGVPLVQGLALTRAATA